jgi:siroheme synthase-like protein
VTDPTPLLLSVEVRDRRVVVIGCGGAGQEKVTRLLAAGARVCVVDPAPPEDLDQRVVVEARRFRPDDVAGAWLVIAATGTPDVDDAVQRAADAAGVWVARADRRDGGGVSFAATLERGPVTVGVATGGASPTLAKWLRDRIATALPEEVGKLALLLSERPRQGGRRGHRDLPLDAALDALASGDQAAAQKLLSPPQPD